MLRTVTYFHVQHWIRSLTMRELNIFFNVSHISQSVSIVFLLRTYDVTTFPFESFFRILISSGVPLEFASEFPLEDPSKIFLKTSKKALKGFLRNSSFYSCRNNYETSFRNLSTIYFKTAFRNFFRRSKFERFFQKFVHVSRNLLRKFFRDSFKDAWIINFSESGKSSFRYIYRSSYSLSVEVIYEFF